MRELPYDPEILAEYPNPEPDLPDLERLDRVSDAVEQLPQQQRTVVELLVWGKYTKAQVAEELGCSRSYVLKLWRLAMATLVQELDDLQDQD